MTGVEASHVCAKLSEQRFEACILELLLNRRFINHHSREPEGRREDRRPRAADPEAGRAVRARHLGLRRSSGGTTCLTLLV